MEIKLFEYQQKEIRTTLIGSDVWFSGQDVFNVLGITWRGGTGLRSDKKIPDSWIAIRGVETSGGLQDMVFISEQALYKVVFTSKPKDKKIRESIDKFTQWVAELLVKVRKGSIPKFVGTSVQEHLSVDVQKQNSKAINAKNYLEGVEAIKKHNQTNCKVHTGKLPHEIKQIGKGLGLKSKDTSSSKTVLRKLKPEIAASMSLTDKLTGENDIETEKAAKICKEFAVPLFEKFIEIGASNFLNLE